MDDLDDVEEVEDEVAKIAGPRSPSRSITSPPSSSLPQSANLRPRMETEREELDRGVSQARARHGTDVLRWSDDDRKAALGNVDGGMGVGVSDPESRKLDLSPNVPLATKVSANSETDSETRPDSPKISPWADETSSPQSIGSLTFPGKAAILGKLGEALSPEINPSVAQVSPQPLLEHGSPSPSTACGAKQSAPDVIMAVSEALLADVVADAISHVSTVRQTAHQRAAMSRHMSPSPTGKSGLVGRQAPERLRIEHSLSPRRTPTSRSPSRSPSPSPSRRRAAAATATDLPSPDPRTASPSPRSPRPEVAEALATNSRGASPSPDASALPVAMPQDTPGAAAQVVSDAATAVLFVQQVLQGVDDETLSKLQPISEQHFLSLAKSQSDLPEWLHIYHKLLFDLVNQQLGRIGAEEVRRRRGPSLHLASDSLYGAKAPPPVLNAEDIRKDLLMRVASMCAVGEPGGGDRGTTSLVAHEHDLLDLEATLLETAVERSVLEMEEEWLRCGDEEETVVLAVVEALFEELVADSAISLLDPAVQLEVSILAPTA